MTFKVTYVGSSPTSSVLIVDWDYLVRPCEWLN